MGRLKELVNKYFYLDLRSLALLRICTGAILIADILDRSRDLTVMYTDLGALPREALFIYPKLWWLPLHMLSGQLEFEVLLFILQGVFALMLLIGYRTTLASILSWIMLNSLQNRNQLLLFGADQALRVLIFWGMFLPWHAKYSIDALYSKRVSLPLRFVSGATIAYILQVIIIYVFAALLKSDPVWTIEGSAIYYALSLEVFRSSFGNFLYHTPFLLKPLTFIVLVQEFLGTFFIFSPFKTGLMRFLVVLSFIGLHIGFGLNMNLGIFPYVSIIIWLALLPSEFWETLFKQIKPSSSYLYLPNLINQYSNKKNIFNSKLGYNSRLVNMIAIFFAVNIIILNITGLPEFAKILPHKLKLFGQLVGIQQKWAIFAPRPSYRSGWYVIKGKLQDGSFYDLYNNRSIISFDKPSSVIDTYKSMRLLLYLRNISDSSRHVYVPYYSRYVCNSWNRTHLSSKKVVSLEVWFVAEYTKPNYQYETKRFLLDQRVCVND